MAKLLIEAKFEAFPIPDTVYVEVLGKDIELPLSKVPRDTLFSLMETWRTVVLKEAGRWGDTPLTTTFASAVPLVGQLISTKTGLDNAYTAYQSSQTPEDSLRALDELVYTVKLTQTSLLKIIGALKNDN